MRPEERFALSMQLSEYAWQALDADGPELAKRRWEVIRRQHEDGCRRLADAFARLP